MSSQLFAFLRSIRKHALLRKHDEIGEITDEESRKIDQKLRKGADVNNGNPKHDGRRV